MAKDPWQRKNGDDDKQSGGNRNDIVGEKQSLLRLAGGLRTLRLCLRSRGPRVVGWDLQFCRKDRRDWREWNGQRRNGLRGGGRNGDRIEARGDFGNGPAPPGVAAESMPRDVEEWLWVGIGHDWVGLASSWQGRRVLRKRFDQG